jgi:hypothetical protein
MPTAVAWLPPYPPWKGGALGFNKTGFVVGGTALSWQQSLELCRRWG